MYILNSRLAADVFDGEYIIANLDTGMYYSVQGLGVTLLNQLPFNDREKNINDLQAIFPENIEIAEELNSLLDELLQEEIVLTTEGHCEEAENATVPSSYTKSKLNRYADMKDLLLLDPIHDVNEEGWTVQPEAK